MILGGWRRRTFSCASETGDTTGRGFDLTGNGDLICTCVRACCLRWRLVRVGHDYLEGRAAESSQPPSYVRPGQSSENGEKKGGEYQYVEEDDDNRDGQWRSKIRPAAPLPANGGVNLDRRGWNPRNTVMMIK
jgi:hypothetical protein